MLQIRLNTIPLVVYAEENGFNITRDERYDFISKIDEFRETDEAKGKDIYFQIPYQISFACSKEEWLLIKRYADLNELSMNEAGKKLIAGAAGKDLYRHPIRDARIWLSRENSKSHQPI